MNLCRRRQERLELGEAVALIEATKNIFREEKNMVELDAPVRPLLKIPRENAVLD